MRIICDSIVADSDHWHPATVSKSARQKLQRAFAAEFLAPIDDVVEHLGGSFDVDSIQGAAEFFDVSELTIRDSLRNNGRIPRDFFYAHGG